MILVIVESPKKAKTLQGFLGKEFRVAASFGHVRDLPEKALGVDVANGFKPAYVSRPGNKLAQLRPLVAAAERILLATDPDREGEAIAWHLVESLHLQPKSYDRMTFHEISQRAVQQALQQPRDLDRHLIDAQQARRILDRLVGYELSPLLWRLVQRGTSAGRVQSVAVRLVVERERAIRAFVPEDYWTIDVVLEPVDAPSRERRDGEAANTFVARLIRVDGQTAVISTSDDAEATVALLKESTYQVERVDRSVRQQSPLPPFTTSTLQQTAARRLHWPGKKTMKVAQDLYEAGRITYHRTDAVRVAEEAIAAARQIIAARFGPDYLPPAPRRFRQTQQHAQEAHEAIRPVEPTLTPEGIQKDLTPDEARLYLLIWNRFIASQMANARYRVDTVDVIAEHAAKRRFGLRARSSTLLFPGFQAIEGEPAERPEVPADDESLPTNRSLPALTAGDPLRHLEVQSMAHQTQPPSRYSEAALIRELERAGVGRPSTYAYIVATIQERGYVSLEKQPPAAGSQAKTGRGGQRRTPVFVPTPLGEAANDVLVANVPNVVDVAFTARLEGDLDTVASGQLGWQSLLADFYGPFHAAVMSARATAPVQRPAAAPSREDPDGSSTRQAGQPGATLESGGAGLPDRAPTGSRGRTARARPTKAGATVRGRQRAAPDLMVSRVVSRGSSDAEPIACPQCGKPLVERTSKYGPFFGCSGFPSCRYVQQVAASDPKPSKRRASSSGRRRPAKGAASKPTQEASESRSGASHVCPKCGKPLITRQQRKTGTSFLGCSGFPACRYTQPLPQDA